MDVTAHVVSQLIGPPPPVCAYHYTSPRALLGIVNSRAIWATDSRYLNDTNEFQYALDAAYVTIVSLYVKLPESDHVALDVFKGTLDDAPKARVYIASFSAQPDLLSQWRAYCPVSGGFAVGVVTAPLIARDDCRFLQCVYDKPEQSRLLNELLGFLLNEFRAMPAIEDEDASLLRLGVLGLKFLEGILILASIFKHPGFAEEQEWRILLIDSFSADTSERDEKIHFREGRSGLVPYIEYSIVEKANAGSLGEVRVGPNPHMELACDAVLSMLRSSGHEARVVPSHTPFRTW